MRVVDISLQRTCNVLTILVRMLMVRQGITMLIPGSRAEGTSGLGSRIRRALLHFPDFPSRRLLSFVRTTSTSSHPRGKWAPLTCTPPEGFRLRS
jgi:hypothetical protein